MTTQIQSKAEWDAKVVKLGDDSKAIIDKLVPEIQKMVNGDDEAVKNLIETAEKGGLIEKISGHNAQHGGKSKRRRRRTGGTRKAGKGKSGKKH
jgi:hypothetical protein